MKRFIRYTLLTIVCVFLLLLALQNRDTVTFTLIPDNIPGLTGLDLTVPMFVVIFGALFIGMILGYIFENIREYRIRRDASRAKRDADQKSRELERLKKQTGKQDDEVLALLN